MNHRHEVGIWASGISDAPCIASCIDCPWTSEASDRDQARRHTYQHMDETSEEDA